MIIKCYECGQEGVTFLDRPQLDYKDTLCSYCSDPEFKKRMKDASIKREIFQAQLDALICKKSIFKKIKNWLRIGYRGA